MKHFGLSQVGQSGVMQRTTEGLSKLQSIEIDFG